MSAKGTLKQLVSGDVFAGKYRLERQFASGGMGFLWRAWNMQLDIPVAVKVMAGAMANSPDFVARFELEAKAAAKIRHPNVVTISEHGVHDELPYMVMELLEGEDLSQRLKGNKRLSMVDTVKIVREMCRALNRAHELGIVHRDIKPANVFLAHNGDEEIVKVLDFGIAKLTQGGSASITATGAMMGTPNYMSPEHIRASKHVDHRADVWSVSVIAFRCLAGQLPFKGPILDMVDAIMTGPVPVPSTLAPDLSPAVDAFFARALARDINQRFQSARELADALGRLVGRESLFEASPFVDAGRESGELPTIAAVRAPPGWPAPPVASMAVESERDVGTLAIAGRVNPAKLDATREAAEVRRQSFQRTMPMDSAQQIAAARALANAKAHAEFNAPPPTADGQRKKHLQTLLLDSDLVREAMSLAVAMAAASASPEVRPAPKAAAAPPVSPRVSRLVWVAVAAVLLAVVAAIWASSYLRKSQLPAPAPAPAASVQ